MAQQASKPTRQQKREAARAEAERIRAAQARRDKRNRTIMISSIVGILALALIAVAVIVYQGTRPKVEAVATKPANATPKGGFSFGAGMVAGTSNPDAKVTVEIYSDYICPYCGIYERAMGSALEELTNDGTITYVIHPLAFLDSYSAGGEYSTRSTNAVVEVANAEPDKLIKFHETLFANQPEEGTTGLSNEQIAQYATESGVSEATVAKLADNTFSQWVKAVTNDAMKVTDSTPYVMINGKQWKPSTVQDPATMVAELKQAVADAGGVPTVSQSAAPSGGATPSESATPSQEATASQEPTAAPSQTRAQ